MINNSKRRACYTCRDKGHLSKDCPNGNLSKIKVVNSVLNTLERAKNDTNTKTMISSPHVGTRTIWVPKSLLTNQQGPNILPKEA